MMWGAYEWDEAKRAANLEKHGLDFEDAENIHWPTALELEPNIVDGEVRERWIGRLNMRIVFVVLTTRGDRIRMISMRIATRGEQSDWETNHDGL